MAADTAHAIESEKTTGEQELARLFAAQKHAYAQQPLLSYEERQASLDKIIRFVEVYEKKFLDAIDADFGGRSHTETLISEIVVSISAAKYAKKNLRRWMRTRKVSTPLHLAPAKSRLQPQALGVVGIISPWNYPLQLALGPAAVALAAGNRVLIKPSELTPRLSEVFKEAVESEFDETVFAIVTGGVETGRAFAETPFDHLLFTGSTMVGQKVAEAAAKNLTPVTLELGGKSPTIIDASADFEKAGVKIARGKLMNAGQTCIAPDYILVDKDKVDAIANAVCEGARSLYPEIDTTNDYSSIISDRHFARLKGLVQEAKDLGAEVIEVGSPDALHPQRKLPLTIVINPPEHAGIMKEEIFGPILPIIGLAGVEEAISHVNSGDRPLALYWFGEDQSICDTVMKNTVAGGVTTNDTVWHFVQENLPFGGVGKSGIGAIHGDFGFETFSHMKPVFHQSRFAGGGALNPPYTDKTLKAINIFRKIL